MSWRLKYGNIKAIHQVLFAVEFFKFTFKKNNVKSSKFIYVSPYFWKSTSLNVTIPPYFGGHSMITYPEKFQSSSSSSLAQADFRNMKNVVSRKTQFCKRVLFKIVMFD